GSNRDGSQRGAKADSGSGSSRAGVPLGSLTGSSGGTGISYDAGRNVLQLRLKLGSHDRIEHHGGADHRGGPRQNDVQGARGENEHRQVLKSIRIHPGGEDNWHHAKSLELLEKAVHPAESRYQRAMQTPPPLSETTWAKNKLAIGGLSFAPLEVLGVNLDEASIRRAEVLGFTRAPASPGAATSLTV